MQLTEHQAVLAAEIGDKIAKERWPIFYSHAPNHLSTTDARLALNFFAVRGAAAALAGEAEDACPLPRDAATDYGHALRAVWLAAYAAARRSQRRAPRKPPLS